MEQQQTIDKILHFWFGHIESTVLPTQNRTRIWFGATPEGDKEIIEHFKVDTEKAICADYDDWESDPRGSLALIILLDQFSRSIYRRTPMAFTQDQKALDVCVRGIERQYDHELSLIERAFFYMPLMHSENHEMQATSVRAFKMLVDLSFPEARATYENFFEYAMRHFEIVEKFGRFPHRNLIVGRTSTPEEEEFMKKSKESWGQ
jgi:uncharacterized protein (DUF924 family)